MRWKLVRCKFVRVTEIFKFWILNFSYIFIFRNKLFAFIQFRSPVRLCFPPSFVRVPPHLFSKFQAFTAFIFRHLHIKNTKKTNNEKYEPNKIKWNKNIKWEQRKVSKNNEKKKSIAGIYNLDLERSYSTYNLAQFHPSNFCKFTLLHSLYVYSLFVNSFFWLHFPHKSTLPIYFYNITT